MSDLICVYTHYPNIDLFSISSFLQRCFNDALHNGGWRQKKGVRAAKAASFVLFSVVGFDAYSWFL